MKRAKLIQKITEFHPSMGVEYGLSTYTGGMKDSGHWFEGRLLWIKKKELKRLIKELEERSKPSGKPVKKYSGDMIMLDNGLWYHEEEAKLRQEFDRNIEKYWFGW